MFEAAHFYRSFEYIFVDVWLDFFSLVLIINYSNFLIVFEQLLGLDIFVWLGRYSVLAILVGVNPYRWADCWSREAPRKHHMV